MNPEEALGQIASEVSGCTSCVLHQTRIKSVPGEGPANAEIMLIGEGPGANENMQGRPFIGQAGKFLDELLRQANLQRSEVFICNVVKCRPPDNRDPLPDELGACDLYLDRQIAAINPKIIITLGRFSMAKYMPGVKISQVHGQMRKIGERFVIPMFHPAAALHQPGLKSSILADFARLPQLLDVARQKTGNQAPAVHKSIEENRPAQPTPGAAPIVPGELLPKNQPEAEEKPRQMKLF